MLCCLDQVMVKLSGKKFNLYKRKNILRPGIVMQAKPAAHLYLIKYEYNNRSREDWFFVDNITCQTVHEQQWRLAMTGKKLPNQNDHSRNAPAKFSTGR